MEKLAYIFGELHLWLFALVPLFYVYRKNRRKIKPLPNEKKSYIEIIISIRTTLEIHGYSDLAKDILDAQMVLGTEGEMLAAVCAEVFRIKLHSKDAYKLISKEANWLIYYGKSQA